MNIQFIFYSEKRRPFVLVILFSSLFYGGSFAKNSYIQQVNNGWTRGVAIVSDSDTAVWAGRNIPVNNDVNGLEKSAYTPCYEIDDKERYCAVICYGLQQIHSDSALKIRLKEKRRCKHQVFSMNSYLVEQFESDNNQVLFSIDVSSCISGLYHLKLISTE